MINDALLPDIFAGKNKHCGYEDSVKLYDALRIHADGDFPKDLIEGRRPYESDEVKNYRKTIWQPITEETVSRVINSLSKIRKAQDWSIKYKPADEPKVAKGEDLQTYCQEDFPIDDNIENWLFGVFLKQYLIDSGAHVLVIPEDVVTEAGEYLEPYMIIFNSPAVWWCDAEFCVFLSTEQSHYTESNVKYDDGKVFYVTDETVTRKYKQIKRDGTMAIDIEFQYQFGEMPVIKVPSVFFKYIDYYRLGKTRINTMTPHLNEASREYSDLQAEVVQHIHSEKWEYSVDECKVCNGLGKLQEKVGQGDTAEYVTKECHSCHGSGRKDNSPYSKLRLRPAAVGETAVPTPPAGYIAKDVEIVKIQDERVEQHKYNALASLNMQFLDQTPLSISGDAKQVDRSELSNFVHSVAADLVSVLNMCYYYIAEYRYEVIIPEDDKRNSFLPEVQVPERFDLIDVNVLMEEYVKAKNANISPVLRSEMEKEIAEKRFSTSPEVKNKIIAIIELDPLAGKTTDEKNAELQNNVILKEDAIISAYIVPFINRAVKENADFFEMDFAKKEAVLQKYAQEKITSISKAEKLKAMIEVAPANSGG